MHIKRFLDIKLPPAQSCFVWGARKTGKSTYVKEKFPDAIYIDLLDIETYEKYSKNPALLRKELIAQPDVKAVIIDEIQMIPILLNEVHSMIESLKRINFILCASSSKRLKSTGANLLGGRAWRYLFQPLCYAELKTLDWARIFNHGLLPKHYLEDITDVDNSLRSYLYDYILPEVQYEAGLRRREAFAEFLDVVGFANGEMVNYSNIARDCGIDAKTVRAYFEILEDMYLGYRLYPYKRKPKRQIITQTPKFYLFDTGMANYLRRYKYTDMIGSEAGRAFEHYIFLELMTYKNLTVKRDNLYYWRTNDGYEVDFIFQDKAVEVKMTPSVNSSHMKSLRQFGKDYGASLHIVCNASKKWITDDGGQEVTVWPVQEFLEALWGGQLWVE